MKADKKRDADARKRYDNCPFSEDEPSQWAKPKKPKAKAAAATQSKGKKGKKKPEFVDLPTGRRAYFLMDCETTGSKRNWDRGIEYCVMAHDERGNLLDTFVSRASNEGVRIKPSAFAVHGIGYTDLKNAPKFKQVGRLMNNFFNNILKDFDAGVLVAHNGATDFQFLCADYQRAGLQIPAKITHTMCYPQVFCSTGMSSAVRVIHFTGRTPCSDSFTTRWSVPSSTTLGVSCSATLLSRP